MWAPTKVRARIKKEGERKNNSRLRPKNLFLQNKLPRGGGPSLEKEMWGKPKGVPTALSIRREGRRKWREVREEKGPKGCGEEGPKARWPCRERAPEM